LTGDVTTVAGALGTTIQPAAVTLAKMANLAANSMIGNNTGVAATPIALTTAQVKTMLNLTGTNSGDVTLAGTGTYLSLAGQVLTQNPIDLSTANASGVLAAGRFPALTGDVTTVAGALGTTIANSAVTYAKMQNASAASLLLGRGSAAGAGVVQEITLGAGLTMTGQVLSANAASGVTYNPGAQQATVATTGANYLFDVAYSAGAVAQSDLGARISSTNTSAGINSSATALTLNATATAGGTATGLVINTSGGAAQPQISLGGSLSGIVTSALPEVYYEETGDTYGTSRLHMQNRTGSNGALFEMIPNAGNVGTDLVDFGFKPGAKAQSNIRLEARSTFQRSTLNTSAVIPEEFQFFFGTTTTPLNVFSVGESATLLETGNFGIGYAAAPATPAGNPLEKLDVHTAAATPANIILSNSAGTAGLLKFQGTGAGISSFQAGAQGATNFNYTLPTTIPTVNQVLTATAVAAPSVTLGWSNAGGGSVAGANTQVQYNNAGAFGASANFTYDGTTLTSTTSSTTANIAAIKGSETGNGGANVEFNGIWGIATSATQGANTNAGTGVRSEGNGTTTDANRNIALEAMNGEFVIGRQASSAANDNTAGNNILVAGEDDNDGLNEQGPSGIVDVTDGGLPASRTTTTGFLTVFNRYAKAHSIILVTPMDGGTGILDAAAGEVMTFRVSNRANGSFRIEVNRNEIPNQASAGTAGKFRFGFLIVNPGK
jgi:hypothetical protein